MSDKLIHLEIVTPKKKIFSDDIKSFTAPGAEGGFQILPDHAPFITTLQPGIVKFIKNDDSDVIFATSGGVVEIHGNVITFLAETIESKDEIDLERARTASERAEKRLSEKEPGTDIVRAGEALKRAKNRLKIAQS